MRVGLRTKVFLARICFGTTIVGRLPKKAVQVHLGSHDSSTSTEVGTHHTQLLYSLRWGRNSLHSHTGVPRKGAPEPRHNIYKVDRGIEH